MATKTESNALESFIYPDDSGIRIRPTINAHKGSAYGVSYLVDVPQQLTGGRRVRIQRSSLKAAKAEAKRQYTGAQRLGEDFFFLSPQDRAEVVDWLPKLKDAGISFKDAVEFALTHLAGTAI